MHFGANWCSVLTARVGSLSMISDYKCARALSWRPQVRRKDWLESMIHHVATTMLLVYSYYVNFTRVGVMVLLVHDISDIFLEAAKLCRWGARAVCHLVLEIAWDCWGWEVVPQRAAIWGNTCHTFRVAACRLEAWIWLLLWVRPKSRQHVEKLHEDPAYQCSCNLSFLTIIYL